MYFLTRIFVSFMYRAGNVCRASSSVQSSTRSVLDRRLYAHFVIFENCDPTIRGTRACCHLPPRKRGLYIYIKKITSPGPRCVGSFAAAAQQQATSKRASLAKMCTCGVSGVA